MLKRIFTINFLDSFAFGITTVALPLLMLERNIDIVSIGLVFSLGPIFKLAVRLASAGIADSLGERWFFTLNGAANFAQSSLYALSTTPALFAAGKAVDGARESFIWAVNRTSVMHQAPEKKHYALSDLVAGRSLYFAAGSLSLGLLYWLGGFEAALVLCAALGLAIAYLSLGVKNTPLRERVKLSDFTMLGRERRFYETMGAVTSGSSFYMLIVYLLAPIYFKLNGYSLWEIGTIYAGYFLIFGVVMSYLSHRKVSTNNTAAVGAAFFLIPLLGLALLPPQHSVLLFLAMAIGDAHLAVLWEEVIYSQVRHSKKRSTDVALLHAPSMLAGFALAGLSGAIVDSWGFSPVFVLGAASMIVFAHWSASLCNRDKKA